MALGKGCGWGGGGGWQWWKGAIQGDGLHRGKGVIEGEWVGGWVKCDWGGGWGRLAMAGGRDTDVAVRGGCDWVSCAEAWRKDVALAGTLLVSLGGYMGIHRF